jgi:inward rectifier potassium channel
LSTVSVSLLCILRANGATSSSMKRTGDPLSYRLKLIGKAGVRSKDLYHWFLRASWTVVLLTIAVSHIAVNIVFGAAFFVVGGVESARPDNFLDAFYFSVQTFGTIGFGHVHPTSDAANMLVTLESLISVVFSALVTGLIFSKFSRPTGRIGFADKAVIYPFNGVPTLSIRIGNERGNRVVEAQVNVDLSRKVTTSEGVEFYRMVQLKLARHRIAALARSFSLLHTIDETSPLFGLTPEQFEKDDCELFVSVTGLDDTSGQPMFGQTSYEPQDVLFGARHADVLTLDADGNLLLDASKFDAVVPTKAIATFRYPA